MGDWDRTVAVTLVVRLRSVCRARRSAVEGGWRGKYRQPTHGLGPPVLVVVARRTSSS